MPVEAGEARPTESTLETFAFHLDGEVKTEDVVLQIAIHGREQLAAACAAHPAASVRIYNPLSPGEFADLSCASILGDDIPLIETGDALKSEPIGEAQQRWSILGLGCSLFILGVSWLLNAGCDTPRSEDPKSCHDVTNWGFGALGVACAFL